MSAKQIGGYCEKRTALVKILQTVEMPYELRGKQKECYNCDGYNYECPDYEGSKINLKGGGE